MKVRIKRGNEVVNKLNSESHVVTDTIKPRKEFDRMKKNNYNKNKENGSKISHKKYNDKNQKPYKPPVNSSDEVTVKARIKGNRRGKDFDREARIKEALKPKFEVSLKQEEPVIPVPVEEVSTLEVKLSTPVEEVSTLEVKLSTPVEEAVTVVKQEEKEEPTFFRAIITQNGEILDIDKADIVGYTIDKVCQPDRENESEPTEEISVETDDREESDAVEDETIVAEMPIAHSDVNMNKTSINGFSFAELVGEKLPKINYSTSKITTPVGSQFSAKPDKDTVNEYKDTVTRMVESNGDDIEATKKFMELNEQQRKVNELY